LGNIGGKIATMTSTFLLSILFSFLIILDLPRLSASVRELENTKLRFIYLSIAGDIRDFSRVLGKALEAQLIVATINSILTAVGISILGIGEHVAFLSVIVFFCSFIPVIGVFISSVPICLVALQVSGVQIMLLAVLLITVIHLIEGYILNPRIYGSYMRINPVIILIILTIGGKLFGFWGLLLGVPFCTYIFGHAIRIRDDR
jgi:predicted PurR-regulated permease PerM